MIQKTSYGVRAVPILALIITSAAFPCIVHAQAPDPDPIEQAISRATEPSQIEEALNQCLAGIQSDPQEADYYQLQAQALRALDRISEIPAALDSAIALLPRNETLVLQRAIALKQLKRFDEMIRDCERLANLGDGLGFQLQAQVAEANGERLKTVFFYTRMIETYPESAELPNWKFERASALVSINVLDWASGDLQASIAAEDGPLKQLLLGELFARAEQWEKAEAALATFKSMTDQHHVGDVRRLNVLMDMDEFDKVAFLLGEYEQKYKETDKLPYVAEIRQAFDERMKLQEQIKRDALKHHRPSGAETYEELAAEQARLKELVGSSDTSILAELKQLTLRRAHHALYNNQPGYVQSMLQILMDNEANFAQADVKLTSAEQAQQTTLLAWTEMKAKEYSAAEASIKEAIAADSQNADAHRVAASIYYMTDQYEPALAAANQAVQLDPMNSINVGYRGLIHTDMGNLRSALQDINEANRLDPNNDWVTQLLYRVCNEVGVPEAAIMYQGQLLVGDYTESLLERCELFLDGGLAQFAILDAIEYSNSVENADPELVNDIIARGASMWFEQTMQFDNGGPSTEQFINACEQAEAASPQNSLYPFLHSKALRYQGEDELAIKAAQQTVALGGAIPIVLHHLASLQLQVGDFEAAQLTNQNLQAIKAEDEEAKSLQEDMAMILTLADDLRKALEQANFKTETGTAIGTMLAGPETTGRVFDSSFASRLDGAYVELREQLKTVKSAGEDRQLRLEWVRAADLKSQDPTVFGFDDQLAEKAGHIQSDRGVFFTAKFWTPGTVSGPSFAYFVRTDSGWHLLPKPWLAN